MNHTICTEGHRRQAAIFDPFTGEGRWVCEFCGRDCTEDHPAVPALPPAAVEQAQTEPARFTIGQVCNARSSCDWDTIFTWTVVARTAKFVTFRDEFGEDRRVRVKEDRDGEWAMPQGRFSMAPVVHASNPTEVPW